MNKQPETIDILQLDKVTGGCAACGGACGSAAPQDSNPQEQRPGQPPRTGARSPSQM